jgi:DNA adenine methylase
MIAELQLTRPFVKWAGSKRQLITTLLSHLPKEYKSNLNFYYEPFLGGGTLLFVLQPKKAVINDINFELINGYQVIKDSVNELIDDLKQHEYEKDYFYKIREWDRNKNYQDKTPVQRASRTIFLNKTCFNGLYRVNGQGQFNTPFGKYKNPTILDKDNLLTVNQYLSTNQVTILNVDFQEAVQDAKKGDFIYLDPPYDPLSKNSKFTGYHHTGFGKKEQIRLKKTFDDLTSRGCYVLLSNAYTDFIIDLYKDYNQTQIPASRAINSKADKRGKVNEILVKNYD